MLSQQEDCSQVGLLWRVVVIEDADEEVTTEVRYEEGPVVVWHGLLSVEDVVDGVDPHEASIVQQVDQEVLRVREQVKEVGGRQGAPEGGHTQDADLVEEGQTSVVRLGSVQGSISLCLILIDFETGKNVLPELECVGRALGTISVLGKRMQGTKHTGEGNLYIVVSAPCESLRSNSHIVAMPQ